MKAVVTDIDHTISDATWRDGLIGQWEDYYTQSIRDAPIEFTCLILSHFSFGGIPVVAITGRPEAYRALTMKWMLRHKVPVDEILMRANSDHRPGAQVKVDLIRTHFPDLSDVIMVLENHDESVKEYRKLGLNVLQVNYGGAK